MNCKYSWKYKGGDKTYGLHVAKCATRFAEGITKWIREIQSENRGEVECAIILMTNELI